MNINTLTGEERLKGYSSFDEIFTVGKSFVHFPFKIAYLKNEDQHYPIQFAVSIPKRIIRSAVKRNLLKRRIREIYRCNKSEFYKRLEKKNSKLKIVIIFIGNKVLNYNNLEVIFLKAMNELIKFVK